MSGPRRGFTGGKKAKYAKGTMKRLLGYIARGNQLRLAVVFILLLVSTVASVASSLFLKSLIDDYIAPLIGQAAPDFAPLFGALTVMACIYLAGMLASYLQTRLMIPVAQGTLKTIRDDMFAHMQTLPIKYFDTHTHGNVMSYYTNDTDTLRQMIGQSLPNAVSSLISITAVFIAMLSTSVWLTLLMFVFLGLIMVVVKKVGGGSAKYFVKQQQSLGRVNGFIEEMIGGQKVVKVFCHEQQNQQDFDAINDEFCLNATKANTYANIMMPIMGNLGHLQYVLVAIVGGLLAIASVPNLTIVGIGVMTLGGIASFLQLSRSFTMPISQVSQQINSVVMALAGAERIFELMDEPSEEDHGVVTLVNAEEVNGALVEADHRTGIWAWKKPLPEGGYELIRQHGDVRMKDVDFAYVDGKPVLHDITLYAEPGQKVAFVGATGAGKTTITNLINRFYDIADGKIRYDGININKIKKSDLRRSLGVVLQDVNLFTGTVMDNIRYGRLDATDAECIEAARLANAHDFISRLPDGYQTVLSGDGGSLSQGQRQLLSIARAAVADPPVMILDEATSSIDTRTEAIVQRGMDRLMHFFFFFFLSNVIYTVQMMLYTQHIGSGTGKVTHAFEFKLVDTGKFEYVRMYALSPEYELMKDANFE